MLKFSLCPPPPPAALIKTGYPISPATSIACSKLVQGPSEPGTRGRPADFMTSLAWFLSPKRAMHSGSGPMKTSPASWHALENSARSERKPYPG